MNLQIINQTNQSLANASSSLQGGVGSTYGLLGAAFATVVFAVVLTFLLSSVQRIEWLHSKLQAFSHSLYYTAVGLATSVLIGLIALPFYVFTRLDGNTQGTVLLAFGGLVGLYVVLTGVGYVFDRLVVETIWEYQEQQATEVAD